VEWHLHFCHNNAAQRGKNGPWRTTGSAVCRDKASKEPIMDARFNLLAALVLVGVGVSDAKGQYATMSSRADVPYTKVVTTTVTTYSPYAAAAVYPDIRSLPEPARPAYEQQAFVRPAEPRMTYVQREYVQPPEPQVYNIRPEREQPEYREPVYVQPRPEYVQPRPVYVQPKPVYAQPMYAPQTYAVSNVQPVYVSRPVVTIPSWNYRPVVQTYQPTYAVSPPSATVAYGAAYGQMTAAAAPVEVGPKVWVHPKVYVEGQPIRNFLKAITP
jgi:hypothetical protein